MLVTATIYVFYLTITTLEKININIIRLDNDIDIDSASSLNVSIYFLSSYIWILILKWKTYSLSRVGGKWVGCGFQQNIAWNK